MAKYWREASSLILASKINFHLNVSGKSEAVNASKCVDRNYSERNEEIVSKWGPDYKVLLLRRSAKSSFMPSGYVFPGGVTNPSDSNLDWLELFHDLGYDLDDFYSLHHSPNLTPMFKNFKNSEIAKSISLRITAIRETFEECGILLCRKRPIEGEIESSQWASFLSGTEVLEWQKIVHDKPSELINLCKGLKCVPDIKALHLWSNWLTPVTFPKRFDTVFFIALLDQIPPTFIDNMEVDEMKWCTPDIVLGKPVLPPPQLYEISRLNNFESLDHLANFAVERAKLGCERWMPVIVKTSDGVVGFLPGDDMYPSSPELFDNVPNKPFTEKLIDLRMKSEKLHRWELNGKDLIFLAKDIQPSCGHVLPVDG